MFVERARSPVERGVSFRIRRLVEGKFVLDAKRLMQLSAPGLMQGWFNVSRGLSFVHK